MYYGWIYWQVGEFLYVLTRLSDSAHFPCSADSRGQMLHHLRPPDPPVHVPPIVIGIIESADSTIGYNRFHNATHNNGIFQRLFCSSVQTGYSWLRRHSAEITLISIGHTCSVFMAEWRSAKVCTSRLAHRTSFASTGGNHVAGGGKVFNSSTVIHHDNPIKEPFSRKCIMCWNTTQLYFLINSFVSYRY